MNSKLCIGLTALSVGLLGTACGGGGNDDDVIEVDTMAKDCVDGRTLTWNDDGWWFGDDAPTPGSLPDDVYWKECAGFES